jgi:thiol-disulfide isomerase/thioredoxin
MKRALVVAAALFLVTGCSGSKAHTSSSPSASTSATVASNQPIFPQVNLLDLNTGQPSTSSSLVKPIVITFWASWCSTCREEFPLWRDSELAGHVIGMNVQDAQTSDSLRRAAAQLMSDNHTVFASYIDRDEVLTSKLGIIGLPITIAVAKDGQILNRHDGVMTKELMLKFIALTQK